MAVDRAVDQSVDQDGVWADEMFVAALAELARIYPAREFFVERDVVYTLQQILRARLATDGRGWLVHNDYPMLPGVRRALSADLALVSPSGVVCLAAEFKYEPCRRRRDVLQAKLPVTVWVDILKDLDRAVRFVREGRTQVVYAILIDEGQRYAARDRAMYGVVQQWDAKPGHDHPVDVLLRRVAAADV